MVKTTAFRLDPHVHKALKLAAVERGVSMQAALTESIGLWLKQRSRGKRNDLKPVRLPRSKGNG